MIDQSALANQSTLESQSELENGVSTAEAARILGLNVQTVRKMIWRGTLPAVQLPSRRGFRWRVLMDEARGTAASDQSQPADQVPVVAADCPESPHQEADSDLDTLVHRWDRIAELEEELDRIQGRLGFAQEELRTIRCRVGPREGLEALRGSRQLASTAPR